MTHHVDGDDGVKALIVEWQATASIDPRKAGTIVEPPLLCESGCCGDALLEKVDPDDARPLRLRQTQGRPAGPTTHVEQARCGAQSEPFGKTLELVGGKPTRLPEVVPICRASYSLPNGETGVGRRVEGDILAHGLTLVRGHALEGRGSTQLGSG